MAVVLIGVVVCALCGVIVLDVVYYTLSGLIISNGALTLAKPAVNTNN